MGFDADGIILRSGGARNGSNLNEHWKRPPNLHLIARGRGRSANFKRVVENSVVNAVLMTFVGLIATLIDHVIEWMSMHTDQSLKLWDFDGTKMASFFLTESLKRCRCEVKCSMIVDNVHSVKYQNKNSFQYALPDRSH